MTDRQHVLIATNREDVTSDFIVLELQRRALPYYRLNVEQIADCHFRFNPSRGASSLEIQFEDSAFTLADIGAAYFRRPGQPTALPSVMDSLSRGYCEAEWSAALKATYSLIGKRWLNHPQAIDAAENKPLQLALALDLGFRIPETRVTNDAAEARALAQQGSLIAKPLRSALIGDDADAGVVFTTAIPPLSSTDDDSVRVAPLIFQRRIEKEVDVRVTVVGSKVFAAAIHSQDDPEAQTDWRRGQNSELKHSVIVLPGTIQNACVALTKHLGLRFGAIDLVLDVGGNWYFLEINPNGQWAWIEYRTAMPITAAIVDELEVICRD